MNAARPASRPSLERLLAYLREDPDNLGLLGDAAMAAFEAGEPKAASNLLARYEAIARLPANLINLKGLAALHERRFEDAASAFGALFEAGETDPAVAFNLAWARAMRGDHTGALELLDSAAVAASPQGPRLKVQTLHHLGRLDEALAFGRATIEASVRDADLMGALAAVALDAGDLDLARTLAIRGEASSDAQAILGLLALGSGDPEEAAVLFEGALLIQPANARALVGRGLQLLLAGSAAAAVEYLDRGAELFARHLGSWIAAGTAHFVCGDLVASRARFERALALDDRFAEAHGSLAVLDIVEGDIASGARRAEIARRLDQTCLSATLAAALLLTAAGQPEKARRLRDITLNRPLSPGGQTLTQAMALVGLTGIVGADGVNPKTRH